MSSEDMAFRSLGLFFLALVFLGAANGYPQTIYDDDYSLGAPHGEKRELAHIRPEPAQELALLRRIVYGLLMGGPKNSAVELKRPEAGSELAEGRSKRTCLFNGGMSHSCDYKDVVGAVKEASYWNSDMSPGRKKRSVDFVLRRFAATKKAQQINSYNNNKLGNTGK